MADETNLVLSGNGLPPYSARGLQQTLEPIEAAAVFRRTVNGTLINLAPSQMQKYRSVITGSDQDPPALDGLWPGDSLTVDCIAELALPTSSPASYGRTQVPGSTVRTDDRGYSFYRPRLTMAVIRFTTTENEYGARVEWQLELEEV